MFHENDISKKAILFLCAEIPSNFSSRCDVRAVEEMQWQYNHGYRYRQQVLYSVG